jgi:hypothetical protein
MTAGTKFVFLFTLEIDDYTVYVITVIFLNMFIYSVKVDVFVWLTVVEASYNRYQYSKDLRFQFLKAAGPNISLCFLFLNTQPASPLNTDKGAKWRSSRLSKEVAEFWMSEEYSLANLHKVISQKGCKALC